MWRRKKEWVNEVVDDEDDDVWSSGCDLHTPHFASVVFDACLVSEGVWVLRHVSLLVLRSKSAFQNIGVNTMNVIEYRDNKEHNCTHESVKNSTDNYFIRRMCLSS